MRRRVGVRGRKKKSLVRVLRVNVADPLPVQRVHAVFDEHVVNRHTGEHIQVWHEVIFAAIHGHGDASKNARW